MQLELTEEQCRLVRRIAGGSVSSPATVRAAAVRWMTGYEDEYDYEIILNYIENL